MANTIIEDLGLIANSSGMESIKQLARGFAASLTRRVGDKTLLEWRKDSLYKSSSFMLSKDEKRVLVGMLDRLRELHVAGTCHGNINVSSILISDDEVKMVDPMYTEFTVTNVEKDYFDLANVIRQFREKLPREVEHLVNHLQKCGTKLQPVYIFNAPCTWSMKRICMVIEYLANRRRRVLVTRRGNLDLAISSASGKDWAAVAKKSSWLVGMFDRPRSCILQFMRDVYAHPPPFNGQELDYIGVTEHFYEIFPDLIAKLIMEVVSRNVVVPGDFIDRHYVGTANSYFAKLSF